MSVLGVLAFFAVVTWGLVSSFFRDDNKNKVRSCGSIYGVKGDLHYGIQSCHIGGDCNTDVNTVIFQDALEKLLNTKYVAETSSGSWIIDYKDNWHACVSYENKVENQDEVTTYPECSINWCK
ncbi:hypothetical protein NCAS_0A03410 [Naumovozyma castellii]|uniref:Killer toxin Kp4 domain-containing protein n=1 Tax=Naumovozyma castellii TaxID=27288 RepID=G0V609_NAUCA|nr:hypothetical protein NCAS_0A03410 [Naumovozyma castellii CBS 4309]CCC66899.1 hypothetical protein NCAS_0A03410 [Naumovozyma castellii CBS 4309]